MNGHTFEECDPPASETEISEFERSLGFAIPLAVRALFTVANGGRPIRKTFGEPPGNFEVSECFAVRPGRGSIQRTYDILVRHKSAVPTHMLPFANASGGNALIVDCADPNLPVFLLTHEPQFRLLDLQVSWKEFWDQLV
jgi:hypothetical protein